MPNTNGIVLTLVAFLASAVTVLGAADHFVLTVVEPLMMGRVDPIINPGEISSHTHTVFGGSNFRSKSIVAEWHNVIVSLDFATPSHS